MLYSYHKRNEEKNKRKLELLEHEKEKEIYQAKIEFFTHVAHEIRTPLTLIIGPLAKIIQHAAEVPAIKNSLQIMQRNADRMMELTSQLLDFRKTEINGYHLNFTQTDIAELLRDNFARFKPTAEQNNLHFEMHSPPAFLAYADVEALKKILSNLLNNAIKYANSKVYLQLVPPMENDEQYTITVKSDGYLIPADMKEKIFETFFRLKETEKVSGTGIGLALSRSLATLHKGSLELKAPEGNLNVFTLTLPVHPNNLNTPLKTTQK
jgi:signal transduction histidine kinase